MPALFKKLRALKLLSIMAIITATVFGAIVVFGGLTSSDVVKLNPTGMSVDSSGAWVEDSAAWALSDRDTTAAYTPAAAVTNVLVTLPAETELKALKVYGSASFDLRVYEDTSGSWTLVPGMSGISLKSQPEAWNTFNATGSVRVRRVKLEITKSGNPLAGIKEIEFWGAETGDPSLSLDAMNTAAEARGVLAVTQRPAHIWEITASPATLDVPADGALYGLTFNLQTDPRLVRRAYLLYDAYNADYLITPEKRINGLSWTGGFSTQSAAPQWTSHFEELSPAWLVKGQNAIEFRNQMQRSDPASYFVRDLKVLVELENGWNAVSTVTAADGTADAAYDGDTTTYYKLSGVHTIDIKTERTAQPQTVKLNLWSASGSLSGTLSLQYQQGSLWKNFSSGGTFDLSTLHDGWNDITVPQVVSADALRLSFNVTPDRRRPGAVVGGITELRLIASPVGSRPARGLVIAYPTAGEYFGRTAHIQGFVEPAATASIEGKLSSNSDGALSLSLTKDETRFATQADNDPWEAVVTAAPGGVSTSKTIALTRNLGNRLPTHTEDSTQASASSREKFTEKIAPGQAKKIQYKGVTLDIPEGAVDKETEITIIPLTEADLNRLNPGMINVTYPDAGYRFLPHGMKFLKPIKISFGYSKQLFAAGQKDEEVNMYFYDEKLLRWVGLKKLKVEPTVPEVISETDHFTDIINSTLVVPEHPQALSFNPNSIKDIKAADPSANVNLIEPPQANNTGTANLSYPIEIPRGRGAYTPDLRITYSSTNANGWMGPGWDIPIPSIQVDTKWGVPTYNPTKESESYLLSGQSLAPVFKLFDEPKDDRVSDRRFYKRVEGDFLKIIRKGNSPTNYSWEVTDKAGNKYFYGLTSQSRLADYQSGNVFQWFLEKVLDTNGNVTMYTYYRDSKTVYLNSLADPLHPPKSALAGEDWVYLYLDTVNYTANEKTGATAQYSVEFKRDSGNRKDRIVGGKSGFKTAQRFRLDRVEVKFQSELVRSHVFEYAEGDFAKSLLGKITAKGSAGTVFYSHTFDYHRVDRNSDGAYAGFSATESWDTPSSDVFSRIEETNSNRNRYRGKSFVPHRALSKGRLAGYINAESDTLSKFQDINGDGLPDLVFKEAVHYNQYGNDGLKKFGGHVAVEGLTALEVESRRTDSGGKAVYVGIGSFSEDRATTVSRSSATLSDINGDGFVDLVSGGGVAYNRLVDKGKFEAGTWSFTANSDLSTLEQETKNRLHLVDPLRKWVAPFSGDIKISGTVQKRKREDAEYSDSPDGDGLILILYREDNEIGRISIAANDYAAHLLGEAVGDPSADSVTITDVQTNERIYFRLNSGDNGENDEIIFDPVITYTAADGQSQNTLETLKDVTGRLLYSYQASQDFAPSDVHEIVWASPYKGTATITGRIVKLPTPDDVVIRVWRTANPDPLVWDAVILSEYSLPAGSTETFDLSETVEVEEGERFLFTVTSDRTFDPARAAFTAEAVFSETKTCELADDYTSIQCTSVPVSDPDKTDDGGNLLYRFSPQINYPLYVTVPKASGLTWVAPYDGTITVSGAVERSGYSQKFIARILGINKSLWKVSVPAGAPADPGDGTGIITPDQHPHNLTLNVTKGEQLFFEIQSEDPLENTVSWTPQITYSQYCEPDPVTQAPVCKQVTCTSDPETGVITCVPLNLVFYPDVQRYYHDQAAEDEAFGGGFRQWYYGQWNGNITWDQSLLVPNEDAGEDEDVLANFVRMEPVMKGNAYSGGQPIWVAHEDRCFISSSKLSSSRLTADVAYSFSTGGVVRQSTGFNTSENFSNMIGGMQSSHGNTDTQIELLDFNGDRYPDQITPSGVKLNDGRNGFTGASSAVPGAFRTIYNSNHGMNIGIGTIVNAINSGGKTVSNPPSASKGFNITDIIGFSFGGGFAEGHSTTKADLIDINGDGLPDLVYQGLPTDLSVEELQIVTVRLNLGNRFGAPEEWRLPVWSYINLDEIQQRMHERGLPLTLINPNMLGSNENRSVSFSVGVDALGYAGASGSVGMGVARSEIQMADVNGDGLPDQIAKRDGENFYRVKINQGGDFGEEQKWAVPTWDINAPIDDIWTKHSPLMHDINKYLKGNDTLTSTASESYSHGFFVNIPIPQFAINRRKPWRIRPTFLILGRDNARGNTTIKSQINFTDIDGDGLPDHVYKNSHSHSISVKLNSTGKANLLKAVKRPLGGAFTLEYERKGNKLDYSNTSQLVDTPYSMWALKKVTLTDGMMNSKNVRNVYTTTYSYDSGYYSRAEREFYGFRTITATRGTGTDAVTIAQAYHNQDYYKKGLLLSSETREGNAQGPIHVAAENFYETRPESVAGSKFTYLTKTVSNFYDATNQSVAKTTAQEYTSYDSYGNVQEYVDRADETPGSADPADDVFASIRYDQSNLSEYIVNRPVSIEVKNQSNTTFRKRTASYDHGTGNLLGLSMLVQGNANADWTFEYHQDGNLRKITYPSGDPNYNDRTQGYYLTYAYDTVTSTYVKAITDAFGYGSSAEYDYGLGLPTQTWDINGNSQLNVYDDFGRLVKVYGPNDIGRSTPALAFEYYSPEFAPMILVVGVEDEGALSSPARAVTKNYPTSSLARAVDSVDTVTFIDGMKRVIQTRKEADVNGSYAVVVSGPVDYDSLGRVSAQGRPAYDVSGRYYYSQVAMSNATRFTYDTLDRTVMVETPDSKAPGGYAVTTTDYGFGVPPQGGPALFMTTVKDPNYFAAIRGTGKGIKVSFRDVHDRIKAVVEHNNGADIATTYAYDLMGQITTVTDVNKNATTVTYNLLGHRLTIDNPDTGKTMYTYDANGNVTTRETANLRKGAKKISYQYEYNRLKEIIYPDSTGVAYTYGAPTEAGDLKGNRAGRITMVIDESGTEERWYGKLGETVKELRQVNAASNTVARTKYQTEYLFDSFGRMQQLTYPDGEVLYYGYDNGGLLKEAYGMKRQNRYPYVKSLKYDEYGQRTAITYGNNVATTYSYDPTTRRLSALRSIEPTKNRVIQNINYTYDLVGNIMTTNNTAPVPAGGELGGPTEQHYTYDDLYQLTTANGRHLPAPNKKTTYTNSFDYDIIGNITRKLQTHLIVGQTGSQEPRETNYDMAYSYTGTQPHAVTKAGDKAYTYDANGNMTGWTSTASNATRTIAWNEENRVKQVIDSGNGTSFLYDDSGERVIKKGGGNESVYINRFYALKNGDLGSKHIFAGETRIVTKLEKDGGSITSGVPGSTALIVSQGIQNAILQGNGQKKGINRRLTPSDGSGGTTGTTNPPIEKFEFFYHGDHLGSSSFITDDAGAVYQHLEYFPYGETWVEDGGSGQMPYYRFTGKELDPETGLYYYGARYYDPVLSRWISADPGLEKFLPQASIASGIIENSDKRTDIEQDEQPRYGSASWMLRNFSWFKNANDSKEEDENLYQSIGNSNRLTTAYPKIYEPIILDLYNYVENAPVNFTDPDGKQRRHMFDVGAGGGGGGGGRVGGPFNRAGSGGTGKLAPAPKASGPHSVPKIDPKTGKVTHYETYKPQTNPKNPNQWERMKRYDATGKSHYNKETGQKVETPHVHDSQTAGGVRKPTPDEIPQK